MGDASRSGSYRCFDHQPHDVIGGKMKSKSFLILVFSLMLTSGCASRRAVKVQLPQAPTSAEETEKLRQLRVAAMEAQLALKKAEEEALKNASEAEKKIAKLEEIERKISSKVGLTGCKPGEVAVDSRAVEFTSFVDSSTITITNETIFPLEIRTAFRGIGVVVKNLCPSGALSLSFARNIWTDASNVQIILEAIGRPLAGNTLTETYRMRLVKTTNCCQALPFSWKIKRRQ